MGESIPLAAPVPVEQAVLETFFSHLGVFSYDKAKDNVEKEREANKSAGGSWLSLLAALAHLAAAEKVYHSLTYLGQKLGKGSLMKEGIMKATLFNTGRGQSFFSRKDSIRTIYTSLHNELKKVVTGRGTLGGTAPHVEELLSHLSEQLCFFVQARMEIADFYEKMYTLSTQKFINAEELVGLLDTILKKYSSRFHHPILSPLESSFQLEVDVLSHLLKAQAQVSEWKFLPSLVNLHSAHTKLQTWGQIFEKQRETKKHLFGGQSQKAVQPPHLFLWLMKLKNMLLAKFSFYFHEALSRQTTASEMKTLTAKANPDLFGKISSFIRKYDAANVSLIFDNRGSESFQGHGYHHPHSYREAPKGVDQYPAVVSLPSDRPVMHWPNVIMIMTDRTSDLNSLEKVVHFYDDKVQSTYFLTRPEPHFTIVVIFESKKSERDSHFISFLNELSLALKNPKVFASLKPGSKG
ncbi:KICSTOR complex protein C12orf66 homolog isoform X1 [Myotis myotis]|uniref:KICSTOR complex protein C12orf66 homolog isoform X1 n=1 Tax=Myotis myotis TaxID=51298 RepID=UPI00174ACACC|nr:KICSTOR complex protein C12orf66 homolog isoform X1 [Myotis myotis]